MTHKPLDRSLVIGCSENFSLEEAVRDAVSQASQAVAGAGADLQVDFQVNRIFGQSGGIAGLANLYVEIRLDSDAAADVPDGGTDKTAAANSAAVMASAIESLELSCLESRPPQFVLRGLRAMPTPGWTFHVDSVKVEHKARRIAIRITDVPPEGMTIQVPGPSAVSVQLGSLRSGRYVAEVYSRRSPSEKHKLLQAMVLEAN